MTTKLHADSEAVKQIFDHFRNVGISAVVLGAARWSSTSVSHTNSWLIAMNWASTTLLICISIALFVLNWRHGYFLLSKRIRPDSWGSYAARFIYGLFIFALFGALTGIDPNAKIVDFDRKPIASPTQREATPQPPSASP